MEKEDFLEAFSHHPKIGASLDSLKEKFAPTKTWSTNEQKSVASASCDTIVALRDKNIAYEERYGFIFIVCATGKSAEGMLEILNSRMNHTCDEEIQIAAREQAKITRLRLEKLEL
jgi:2-oxo-4-hydroxy-4-carboxy-5-ureidoimidazoline decarboxylase